MNPNQGIAKFKMRTSREIAEEMTAAQLSDVMKCLGMDDEQIAVRTGYSPATVQHMRMGHVNISSRFRDRIEFLIKQMCE